MRKPEQNPRKRKADLSLEELSKYFDMKIVDASKELGISSTLLKKICRKYGIKRWPYRKLQSVNKQIDSLQNSINQSVGTDVFSGDNKDALQFKQGGKFNYYTIHKNLQKLNKLNEARRALTNDSQQTASNLPIDPLSAAISPTAAHQHRFNSAELSPSSPLTKELQSVFDTNLHITSPSSASSAKEDHFSSHSIHQHHNQTESQRQQISLPQISQPHQRSTLRIQLPPLHNVQSSTNSGKSHNLSRRSKPSFASRRPPLATPLATPNTPSSKLKAVPIKGTGSHPSSPVSGARRGMRSPIIQSAPVRQRDFSPFSFNSPKSPFSPFSAPSAADYQHQFPDASPKQLPSINDILNSSNVPPGSPTSAKSATGSESPFPISPWGNHT